MHNLVVKNHKGNLIGVLDKTYYERVARVNGDLYTVFNIYDTENNKDVIRNIDKRWTIEIIQDESKDEFVVQNIYEKFEDNNLVLEVDTLHRTYDELKREVMNVSYTGSKTAEEWFKYLFEGSKFKHDTDMSFKYAKSLDNFGYDNRLNLLFRLCDTFNVEFYIVGNTVHIVNTIGYNKQDYIEYGVNLTSISRNRVMEGFGTRITVIGKPITDEDDKITGYHTYTYTHELSKEYGIIDLPPVVDERYTDKESMKQRCIDEITSSFTTSLEVEVSDLKFKLGKTDLLEGDYIRIFDPRLNFNSSIRVVETRFTIDEFGEYINRTFVLGDYNESYSSSIKDKNQIKDLENSLAESNKVINYVQNSADGKNKIFYGRFGEDGLGEPIAENVGDLWFKPNREYTIGYMWNGKEWEEFLNTETEDLIKDELEQMDKDVQEAKDKVDEVATGLDIVKVDVDKAIEDSQKAKEDAIKAIEENETTKLEAQKAKEQSDKAIKDATSSMLTAKDALSKATENETSIGGLQVDVDKANNELKTKANQSDLNALKGTVTNQQTQITQNATDIETKAEKTYVDTVNNKVDKQQTQINQNSESIKLKAEKQEVTNLKNELDGLEFGGRNLILNSELIEWDNFQGATSIHTHNVKVDEWKTNTAINVKGNSGEHKIALTLKNANPTTSIDNQKYVHSIYIRNNSTNVLDIGNNTGKLIQVNPKQTRRIIMHSVGNGTMNLQFVAAVRHEGNSFDFDYWHPKIETGDRATDWSPAPEDLASADQVKDISASLEVQAGKIEMKADQVVVDNLKNTVNKQGTAMTQNSEAIKLKAEKSQVDSLTGKVDKQQTEINQNAEQIKLKANQSTVNDIDAKVTSQQTQINLNSENIKLKAEKSEVTNLKNEVDGLEFGGTNLLLNTNSDRFDRLMVSGDGVTTASSSKVSVYEKKLVIENHNGIRDSYYRPINGSMGALKKNTDYIISGSVQLGKNSLFRIRVIGSYGNTFEGISSITFDKDGLFELIFSIDNRYTGVILSLDVLGESVNEIGDKITLNNLKLEKGNRATAWSPAPEDLATQIDVNRLESSIAVEAGKITNLTSSVNKNSIEIGKLTVESNKISSQVVELQNQEIGGRNLLADTSTFSGNLNLGSNSELVKNETYLNNSVLKSKKRGATTDTFRQKTTIAPKSKVYTLSFWAKSVNQNQGMNCYFYNPNTTKKAVTSQGRTSTAVDGGITITLTSDWRYYWITWEQDEAHTPKEIIVGRLFESSYGDIFLSSINLVEGNKSIPWTPAPEDLATQSQITQLSDDILLRVQKGDVINQINVSTEGILIDGKKVHITGQTKIDNAVIKDAMIDSMTANKLTAGAIDANKIRVLNIDANNITSGYISSNRIKSKSITSDKIDVMSLSAISADLGRVTAGQLNAVDIYGSRISGGWLMPDSTYVTVDKYTNGNRYTWNSFTKYGYFSVTETRNTNTNDLEEIFIYSMTRDGILAEKYSATTGITEGQGLGCPTDAGMINLSFGKRTYYRGEPKYYLHSKNPSLKPRDVLIP